MIKAFTFWLEGLIEDDPLPDEIDVIVFKINFNGKYKYLSLLGLEKQPNFNQVPYMPLEAQGFIINDLLKASEKVLLYKIKELIDEAFSSQVLKQQFKNRKIYLFYKTLEFLFKIWNKPWH